jgi:monovalent cation/hydrogen antiporter
LAPRTFGRLRRARDRRGRALHQLERPPALSAATRLQGIFFWNLFIYLIEGLVFLITGLQARTLIARIGGHAFYELATSAMLVSAVVIVTRFVWMYPATYLPRWLYPLLKRRHPAPPWQWPFVLAFTGVRGIVSHSAALAISLLTADGQPFPDRDLILFLTFSMILVTLVGQGLMLPALIRALCLAHAGRLERRPDKLAEHKARRQGIEAAINRLEELRSERKLSDDMVQPLRARHREGLKHIEHRIDGNDGHRKLTELHDEIELLLITAERQHINELYRGGGLKDEARRRIERELDLREVDLADQLSEE